MWHGWRVEIKVGIQRVNREIIVDTPESADSIEKAFASAVADGGLLTLVDQRGRKVLIPASTIGYIDIGEEHARPVGFGSV
jgi:hypothetical protein